MFQFISFYHNRMIHSMGACSIAQSQALSQAAWARGLALPVFSVALGTLLSLPHFSSLINKMSMTAWTSEGCWGLNTTNEAFPQVCAAYLSMDPTFSNHCKDPTNTSAMENTWSFFLLLNEYLPIVPLMHVTVYKGILVKFAVIAGSLIL